MKQAVDFLKNIRNLNEQELNAKIGDSKKRLQKLSISHKLTPLENPKILNSLRKDIARMKTVLNNKI